MLDRDDGSNRVRGFRGQVDKYTWVDIGSSYVPSEVLAAILAAQFHALDEIVNLRSTLRRHYLKALAAPALDVGFSSVDVPRWNGASASGVAVLAGNEHIRRALLGALSDTGDSSGSSADGCAADPRSGRSRELELDDSLAVTADVKARLLRMPFHTGMSTAQVDQVAGMLHTRLSGGTGAEVDALVDIATGGGSHK
jgi:dTDP-4-amino-4,6-dideoxygalactose transaminase